MLPEQHLSHIDLMRCVTVGHFKGGVSWQGRLSYGVNKGRNIDVSQAESDGGPAH